jgi:asparagine synthase (glutamine-hydrolysing)
MCGIAGYHDARRPATAHRTRAMTDRLVHRGPDASGVVLVDTRTGATSSGEPGAPNTYDLALGHRRLSILDLTEAGRQPMSSADGRKWIVYNGEIYNYVELRDELRARGHRFRTATDTEVLLAAYAEWGIECLQRCNGMFAFALWDGDARALYLARDRLGVKPLYYAHGDGWLVFGSEIKALLAHPLVPRAPDDAIVYDFLALRLADHTERTFFEGISCVPGAHYLEYRPGRAPELRRWWDCRPARAIDCSDAEETRAIDRFRELFDDAVRVRLRSDVPIGTCLSGGVDSSSIVVTANRLMFDGTHDRSIVGERQRTFSACFEDARFDERPFIDRVIGATGASTHRVFPSDAKLWDELPALVAQMDEPFHSTSQYSQYNVMRLVRESGVTVTLDGQGADELMAGYGGYHSVVVATLVRAMRPIAAMKEAVATAKLGGRGRGAIELVLRAAYALAPTSISSSLRAAIAPHLGSRAPEGRSFGVIRGDVQARFASRRDTWADSRAAAMGDLGTKLYEDAFQFGLPPLLRYADRNSMAFSIESRMPLLDYRLVEHVLSLPLRMIVRDGWTKYVFRRAMQDRLPREVQWRKDKMGFVTPEGEWIKRGRERIAAMLGGELHASAYLDAAKLRGSLDRFVRDVPSTALYTDVFRWLVLELWMRHAFGSSALRAPADEAPATIVKEAAR